jgi:hypothetical protein
MSCGIKSSALDILRSLAVTHLKLLLAPLGLQVKPAARNTPKTIPCQYKAPLHRDSPVKNQKTHEMWPAEKHFSSERSA